MNEISSIIKNKKILLKEYKDCKNCGITFIITVFMFWFQISKQESDSDNDNVSTVMNISNIYANRK